MLSSLSGIVGNRGQAAYAATNTFLNGFTAYRRSLNLPAPMIDTGAVEDIGYVAEAEEQRQATINHLAHDHIKEKEFFALVKDAIVHAPDISGQGQVLTSLKFSHCIRAPQSSTRSSVATKEKYGFNIRDALGETTGTNQVVEIITKALITKISELSMAPAEDIVPEKPLTAYGMDSLVGVGMRNWLIGELGVYELELRLRRWLVILRRERVS
ncbi:hypothetical protein MMC28_000646 [Mycoblastus sanguinarius]|nr:hypothetical protein [Mycoblastus sanguinarius]